LKIIISFLQEYELYIVRFKNDIFAKHAVDDKKTNFSIEKKEVDA